MKHFLIMFIATSLAVAKNNNHLAPPPVRQVQQPNVFCVCEYDPGGEVCEGLPEAQCRRGDCAWLKDSCRNINQFYCETEFQDRKQVGCRQTLILKKGDRHIRPPGCGAGVTDYHYTYHGHGPRRGPFIENVAEILNKSQNNRQCKFYFQDQSCSSFQTAPMGIKEAREILERKIKPLIKGQQEVTVGANQVASTATLGAPFIHRNPFWAFRMTANVTKESSVECPNGKPENDIACLYHSDNYLCFDQNKMGFRQRACCCKNGNNGGEVLPGNQSSGSSYSGNNNNQYDGARNPDGSPRVRSTGVCRWWNGAIEIQFPIPMRGNVQWFPRPTDGIQRLNCPQPLPPNPVDGMNWNKFP